ncbi:hypothetical protein IAQ61_005450 [Plenodomus lingam]|uniref:Similar to chromosome condensation protein n=1 Tax=Leptosphaeria maculans (strain JN3 / isolate v23.1.3 / race Av1-4-5-6-7-8) TaxID=985895 RepID=E4ZZ91_LEPMJ|nr:similar to chromosome condensation protein [Plenodomus lingam JN3]KAH9871271.1 hypothetical protein IAQ61_005450 [Plenodomus lingam]CBX96686.1 similar to chromosome condensation protein [Plenodomus lingam JN3]
MTDAGDDDVPVGKRESHFNNQRSSHRSSLRSEVSLGQLHRMRTHSDLRRLDDFGLDLDFERAQADRTDRTDSEAPPSPSSAASPAPNVPYTRSRGNSDTRRTWRSAKRTSRSTAESNAGEGRAVEQVPAPESWVHLLELNTQSPNPQPPLQPPWTQGQTRRAGSYQTQMQRARGSSFPGLGIGIPGIASDSHLNITALPNRNEEKLEEEGGARYHGSKPTPQAQRASEVMTELYTISYLIFFSIWGTLARVGLQALTFYPGAPVVFSELWSNVAGTLVMGFLAEDRKLFRLAWGIGGANLPEPLDRPAEPDTAEYHKAKARHGKIKKTIPVYIGLVTGFCGSCTSFSSFIRDVFLSLSNDLPSPISHPYPVNTPLPSTYDTVSRNGGYSFMAICATIIITVTACYSALKLGSHLAVFLDPYTPTLPFRFTRRVVDPMFVFLGWGTWIGAVLMAVFPPQNAWRGQAIFACVFAPLGCLLRYYISCWLNATNPNFPLGTFTVNVFGTAVLGMAYDLQHVSLSTTGLMGGGIIGCQVLQGIEDGFCGALTTVSTWMSEIDSLKRRYAYMYGAVSVVASLCLLIVIMGSVRWTVGWHAIICKT